jgi:hypothetical protein
MGSINSAELLEEFTMLYMALAPIQLNDQNDEIVWKWTGDGKY